jgi:hypothetical protein
LLEKHSLKRSLKDAGKDSETEMLIEIVAAVEVGAGMVE